MQLRASDYSDMFGRTSALEPRDHELPMPATFARRFLLEEAASAGDPTFVWRAQEIATRAPVALTFFPAAWLEAPRSFGSARELVVRMRELKEPGVIGPTEVIAGQPWSAFVSPWIEGPTLRQMQAARPARRFEADELRPWLCSLLPALEAVHAHGFVHGGLDPGMVIQRGATLCVVNAAVCAWLDRAAERHGVRTRHGSDWPYRSPARRRGEAPGAVDDIFALGAILFELLTGACPELKRRWFARPPRHGIVQRERRRRGSPGREIPVSWERAIWRCLDPRERNRLGSVGELRIRLDLAGPKRAPEPARPSPGAATRQVPVARPPTAPRVRPPVDAPPSPPAGHHQAEVRGLWGLRLMVFMIALATAAVAGAFVWQLVEKRPPAADPAPRTNAAGEGP